MFRCMLGAFVFVIVLEVICVGIGLNFSLWRFQDPRPSTKNLNKLLKSRPKGQQCPVGILNTETHSLEVNPACPDSAELLLHPPSPSPSTQASNKTNLTFFLLYYNDHRLLAQQLHSWTNFSQAALEQIQFLVVDDGSAPGHRAEDFFLANLEVTRRFDLSIYRIDQDIKWNVGGARNLGFWVARTPWVFMSDVDTLVAPDTMDYILSLANDDTSTFVKDNVNVSRLYGYFQRSVAEKLKAHPAVLLATRKDYWIAGGCDEDFVGNYGHTDVHFWHRVKRHPTLHLTKKKVEMGKMKVRPLIDVGKHIECPPTITCLEKHTGKNLSSRDGSFNELLMKEKRKTDLWSTEYLRFTWKQVLFDGS